MEVLQQLRDLRKQANELKDVPVSVREKIQREARQMMLDLEAPQNTIFRIAFQQLEIVSVSIACHSGLFKSLAAASPQRVSELSKDTGVDPLLAERILRCLASYGAVDQLSPDTYSANKISRTFADDGAASGIEVNLEFHGRSWPILPSFLRDRNWQNFTGVTDTPATIAWGMKKGSTHFDVMHANPHNDAFNLFMSIADRGFTDWTTIYPIQSRLLSGLDTSSPDAVLMVDVGGGNGHQAARFKEQFPDAPGRYIVQDRAHTFPAEGSRPPGIEFMVHDFTTEQPIKGARFYYLRFITHDWAQDVTTHICAQIRKAMTPGYSRLIVNERIVPSMGAAPASTSLDLVMMAATGGMERTVELHRGYLEGAGLRVTGVYVPEDEGSMGVIEAEVA